MLLEHESTAILARNLRQIKLLHTAIWSVLATAILALAPLGWFRKFRWAFALSLLIIGECLVLAVKGGSCPLTDIATRYTNERSCNFDIYLPLWMACYNKIIFGFLFIVGELIVMWRWARRPRT